MASPARTHTNQVAANCLYFKQNMLDYQTWQFRGETFAVFNRHLQRAEINIQLKDHHIVLLGRFDADSRISIQGKTVIALNEMHTQDGEIVIKAFQKYIRIDRKNDSTGTRSVEALEAVRICNLGLEQLEYIDRVFKDGIANKKGDLVMEGVERVVMTALEYPLYEMEEGSKEEHLQIVCDYFNIAMKA